MMILHCVFVVNSSIIFWIFRCQSWNISNQHIALSVHDDREIVTE